MGVFRSTTVALATAATGALTACTIQLEETVHGSGVPASEIRAVSGFDGLLVDDSLNVSVEVGASSSLVTIHADDNLMTYVTTEIEDGRLIIAVQDGYRLDPMPQIQVRSPALSSVTYAGSGRVQLESVSAESLKLTLAGAGELDASGQVVDLDVRLMGSGDLDLFDLLAEKVQIDATGSGDVRLFARDKLYVRRIGSGDVVYRGSPILKKKLIGSGDIRPAQSHENESRVEQ
jgi:hypothetical protein